MRTPSIPEALDVRAPTANHVARVFTNGTSARAAFDILDVAGGGRPEGYYRIIADGAKVGLLFGKDNTVAAVSLTATDGTAASLILDGRAATAQDEFWIDGTNSWCRDIASAATGTLRFVFVGRQRSAP